MAYVALGCRCMVGLVFAASVLGKLRGRESHARFVAAAGRLGPGWVLSRIPAPVVAGGVIAAEAAVLVLLVPPGTAWIGFALAGLLAMAFAVAVLAALRRGDRAPCQCFGGSDRPVSGVHLVRNGVLAAAAALGTTAGAVAAGPLEPAGGVIAAVAGAVVAAFVVTADDLAGLFRPVVSPDGHHATKGFSR
ncbi:MauE/DoxX family redox-associated membrane protein [Actinomadura welshii]|uniref:MauE/DoxX family redox-associated membrane protein n=1 Tax=Actinomadura welshii TaxID=3103817 RepID=UPI0003AD3486|nr:MauE/DoxX family redox-associated membrane protein [Actinomadura madurae]